MVAARVLRAGSTQELSSVLEPGALAEARRLTEILRDDDGDVQARYTLGWLHYYRALGLPAGEDHEDLEDAVRMFAFCLTAGVASEYLPQPLVTIVVEYAAPAATAMLQEAVDSPSHAAITAAVALWQRIVAVIPADHPNRARGLTNLGLALRARFQRTGDVADLDAAVQNLHQAVDRSLGGVERARRLANLAEALRLRFERIGARIDLDAAIEAGRAAVAAISADHPDRPSVLNTLGNLLRLRFERTGARADLDAAIETLQKATATFPADRLGRGAVLGDLGNALRLRFERTGAMADLDAAIDVGRAAVAAEESHHHVRRAAALGNLGTALRLRFERVAATADLDAAIQSLQQAVTVIPVDHVDRAMHLNNLAVALLRRFEHTDATADLEAGIQTLQQVLTVIPEDHPNRAMYLSNLGNALCTRFERTGRTADLNAAIEVCNAAVDATPADHPLRASHLNNLGNVLRARYARTGRLADLEAAIEAGRAAMSSGPVDHPRRARWLNNLGGGLRARFERTGSLADLDAAIQAFRHAVAATPSDHPDLPRHLSNLGGTLRIRFERTGSLTDLDAAIEAGRAAVSGTPAGHPHLATRSNNLGGALLIRFGRTGALTDLGTAIHTLQQAVGATPVDHPHRAMHLTNLGNALLARFEQAGAFSDLRNAIDVSRAAIAASPADHPDQVGRLNNLGAALQARFGRTGARADLNAAIKTFRQAVATSPSDHPDRARLLDNLGNALKARLELSGAPADRDAAVSACVEAMQVSAGPPSIRIQAARAGASLAAPTDPGRAASLLEMAVRLLPEVAPRRLERRDQQHALSGLTGLAADAAALALADTPAAERAPRALRLLESGRTVLLSQALDTRSDLTDLRQHHPDLAERFVELRNQLDQPSDLPTRTTTEATDSYAGIHGRVTLDRVRLADEFAETLANIRTQPGFASFALPPTASELLAQASAGAVVVFNVSVHRSDALLATEGGITSLRLTRLTYDALKGQIENFHRALNAATAPGPSTGRRAAQRDLCKVLEWLWDTAAEPVLEALGYRDVPPQGTGLPRVWWAPGGLLSQIPFHAAGYHTDRAGDRRRRTVMDRVISSFTPTIRALHYARQQAAKSTIRHRALIIAMATTPGFPGMLNHVGTEAAMVRTHLPESVLLAEPDPWHDELATIASPHSPTKANVLDRMPGCAVVHFACHGTSHPADPSQSRLLLHDHNSAPLTVASVASLTLEYAQLAYLSACHTAFGTAELIDEAIHLTSAFQLAGFPHVVGTLWEIDDSLAVDIADAFYTALTLDDGTLDFSRAANALHDAVRAVRDRFPRTPSLWASYLHAGA